MLHLLPLNSAGGLLGGEQTVKVLLIYGFDQRRFFVATASGVKAEKPPPLVYRHRRQVKRRELSLTGKSSCVMIEVGKLLSETGAFL